MWERFDHHLKDVITKSRLAACRMNQSVIEPIHFLVALCNSRESTGAQILSELGFDASKIVEGSERPAFDFPMEIDLSDSAKRVVKVCVIEARNRNDSIIGTEHLLLSLATEEDGHVKEILSAQGVGVERIDFELKRLRSLRLND